MCLKEKAPTREGLDEGTGSPSSATHSGTARGSGPHTPPPPSRPTSAPGPTDSWPSPWGLSRRRNGPGIPVSARFHLLNRGGSDLPLASLPRGRERYRHVAAVTTIGKSGALRVNSKLGERRRPLGLNHLRKARRGDAPRPNKQRTSLAERRNSGPYSSSFGVLFENQSPRGIPCSRSTSRPSASPFLAPPPSLCANGKAAPSPPSASAIQEMVPPPRERERLGQPLSQEMRAARAGPPLSRGCNLPPSPAR